MALHYLNGLINNTNTNKMEDLGILYPKRRIRKRPINKLNAKMLALRRYKLLKNKLSTVTEPKMRLLIKKRLAPLERKINGDLLMGELGKSKRKNKPKRTKGQLLKKVKTTLKKAKERRKADKHSPKEKAQHKIAKVALAVPRGAFLGLILLGKALEKSPIKINLAKNLRDKWSTKGKAIEKLWYKLGGEVDILKTQISKATNSKLSGEMGVVVAATTAGSIAAASPIVVKILKIIGKAQSFAKKNPKLLAVGEKLLKGKLSTFAKKKGKSEELTEVADVVSDLTESLPQETKESVESAGEEVSTNVVAAVDSAATKEVEETKENIQAESSEAVAGADNTKMIAIGAAVLIGGYLLMKKK